MSGINAHRSFLKLAAGISLILFNIFSCETGYSAGLQSLPSDLEFQTDTSRTTKILTALLLENNRRYKNSVQVWSSLPQENEQVRTHLYYNRLALNRHALPDELPISIKSRLLMSRYQSWQRQWHLALRTLEEVRDKDVSNEVRMEQIRLNLILGNYDKVEKLIRGLNPYKHRERMQLEVFSVWLDILKGNKEPARVGIGKLEENYLYLPLSTMFPVDLTNSNQDLGTVLKSMLMRFPSNSELFEQLLIFTKKHKKWKTLDELVRSQMYINSSKVDWDLLAEVYLQTGQFKRLEKLIKSRNSLHAGPSFYDILARLAMKRKNWELLHQVSKSLQSHYPELRDGLLYQAIYYRETGRKEKAEVLLRQAGL